MIYKNTNSLDADIEATYYLSTKEKEFWIKIGSFGGTLYPLCSGNGANEAGNTGKRNV